MPVDNLTEFKPRGSPDNRSDMMLWRAAYCSLSSTIDCLRTAITIGSCEKEQPTASSEDNLHTLWNTGGAFKTVGFMCRLSSRGLIFITIAGVGWFEHVITNNNFLFLRLLLPFWKWFSVSCVRHSPENNKLTLCGHLLQICNVSSFFVYSLSVEFPVAVVDVSRFATFEYQFLFRKYFCHAF